MRLESKPGEKATQLIVRGLPRGKVAELKRHIEKNTEPQIRTNVDKDLLRASAARLAGQE